jgi:transcriptional regulator with PAS, ATPase and Fis domain
MSPANAAEQLEHAVFEITRGVWSAKGEDFFHSLARQLCQVLQADFVLVGKLHGAGRVKALAVHTSTGEVPGFEYELSGTPCAGVVESNPCCYQEGIRKLFPADVQLVEMGAEGYVGAPLVGADGRCLGLICAITRQPLANPRLAESVLQIFAMAAAAELQLIESAEALALAEERQRSFAAHTNEAIVRFATEKPIPLDLPEDEMIDRIYRYGYVEDCNDQAAVLFRRERHALIGSRLDFIAPRSDPAQLDRVRAFFRARCVLSQVERTLNGRHFLMTREGIIEGGCLVGTWATARDITEQKLAETQVRNLNRELESRVEELNELRARLQQDNDYLREEIRSDHPFEDMVGSSPRFRELASRIQMVASTSATVLISGETGTGKELVARAIHNLSDRRGRPLVKVNCAAITAGLVESELFGHVRGAFTGAVERRVGRFEYANGGTLFLDEITELPLEIQAKLLRVLQEREFEPVGSNQTVKVDVRLLAATNLTLSDAVREGRFRMDLYYRLLVVPVEVPALRERREDIPALAAHFIERHGREYGRRVDGISPAMMQQMMAYDWPGNIRELDNVLARAMVLSAGGVLDAPLIPVASAAGTPAVPGEGVSAPDSTPRTLEEAERRHIEGTLSAVGWVLEGPKGAAAVLGLNPSTLRGRMKRLGIQRPSL